MRDMESIDQKLQYLIPDSYCTIPSPKLEQIRLIGVSYTNSFDSCRKCYKLYLIMEKFVL